MEEDEREEKTSNRAIGSKTVKTKRGNGGSIVVITFLSNKVQDDRQGNVDCIPNLIKISCQADLSLLKVSGRLC